MDYKEKIRLAKEALDSGSYDKETIEYIFPELKESEDEKIRKDIISHFAKGIEGSSFDEVREKYKNWIAWLEKQGKNNMGISESTKQKLEDNLNKALANETSESWNEFLDEGEKKPKRMVSAEAKEAMYDKPAWSEEDEAVLDALIRKLEGEDIYVSPHLAVECLKSLKDRVQPQPKQEWSEEDEERLSDAIFFVREYQIPTRDKRLLNAAKETEDWLRTLRPQNTWKPSDEQMEALRKAEATIGVNHVVLAGLISDLEKLTE